MSLERVNDRVLSTFRSTTGSWIAVGFVSLALVQSLHRFLTVEYGSADKHWDVWMVWEPLAEVVLEGGRLYLGRAVDNKPPLFELLNVLVAATGHYYPVFLLLIGLANATAAILLWRLLEYHGTSRDGIVAGAIFLAALPLLDGTAVNVRSFALVGVLVALQVRSPWLKGSALAVGGLFSQYALLAVPIVVYDGWHHRTDRRPIPWMGKFGLAGVGVVICSFGVVAVLWGLPAAVAGVEQSFGTVFSYSTRQGQTIRSPIANPLLWAGYVYDISIRIVFVLIPAVVALGTIAERLLRDRYWEFETLVASLAVVFSLSIFVRALPFYWLLPLPFYAGLAAFQLRRWYSQVETVE